MLQVTNVSLIFGDRKLLNGVSFQAGYRDKIGLVGRNGAGKSTLLKIIAGMVTPTTGQVQKSGASKLGYLTQDLPEAGDLTVKEAVMESLSEIKEIEDRYQELQKLIEVHAYESDTEQYHDWIDEWTHLNEKLSMVGADQADAEIEKILKGLGFKQEELSKPLNTFSGGWQMRVQMAKILVQQFDYLLLDEPTNHLDIESIIWLEVYLKNYPNCVIIVSHDRQFLDNITNRTLEIELGNLYDYKANYSKYLELRADRREKLEASFKNQGKVIAQKEKTIARFMAKANKTSMAQSMQKQLAKMDRIELEDVDVKTMNINFQTVPRSGEVVAEVEHLSKSYDKKLVLKAIDLKILRGDRIAFVGQNGQGKTTLVKILAKSISQTSGKYQIGHNVEIGYYAQNQADELHGNSTVLQSMEQQSPPEMRTKIRAILGAFMFSNDDVDKKVTVLSGGERARLALAILLLKPINFLILDEPTNHLDMLSKEVLKEALLEYTGTLVVVSHDRDFLTGLTKTTMEFRDHHIKEFLGDVNYYLDKRQVTDLREVSLSSKVSIDKISAILLNPEEEKEKKKIQKLITTIEQKIERQEEECKNLEKIMAGSDFYEKADFQITVDKYAKAKDVLMLLNQEWEEQLSILDAI
ncbi:MAG TPA: ABC-F family ATP-binding cassette domain-containing protein [Saprospiraceae bacterium]|nr:ABC-F family ATP-binding cassette domain-containing protein [Saprospiraceae bacterium]